MLRFIARTEKEVVDSGILETRIYQGCDCGRGTPEFGESGTTIINAGNCWFCRYFTTWNRLTNKSEGYHQCLAKHKCQGGLFPLINMTRPLNEQWTEEIEIPGGGEANYEASAIIRQVVFEGQPLYAQFYAQNGFNAHCNAFCAFHKWRLDNKKTWRQCARSHKCWQDGSGWALLAPVDDTLYQEFVQQL